MIYGYIRVSTDKQSVENQRYEIEQFSSKNDIVIDKWIEETTSSQTDMDKRKLGKLLKRVKKGDILIASELSRLGRNLLQVMGILHHCMNVECQVWTIKDNYRLGADIQSKVLAFAFGLSAEIERNLISQRTKEALNRLKAEGRVLGRPKGSKSKNRKGERKAETINKLLAQGVAKTQIAKIVGMEYSTLYRHLQAQESTSAKAT